MKKKMNKPQTESKAIDAMAVRIAASHKKCAALAKKSHAIRQTIGEMTSSDHDPKSA